MADADESTSLQQLQRQPVVSIRGTVRIDQLAEVMDDRMSALSAYLRQSGASAAGPAYVRYHTFEKEAGETDLETGIPVSEPVASEDQIVGGELPAGRALTTWHFGSPDKLGEAYSRIDKALQEYGGEPAGPPWEVYYWFDPANYKGTSDWPDPSTWRMQLIQPLK